MGIFGVSPFGGQKGGKLGIKGYSLLREYPKIPIPMRRDLSMEKSQNQKVKYLELSHTGEKDGRRGQSCRD